MHRPPAHVLADVVEGLLGHGEQPLAAAQIDDVAVDRVIEVIVQHQALSGRQRQGALIHVIILFACVKQAAAFIDQIADERIAKINHLTIAQKEAPFTNHAAHLLKRSLRQDWTHSIGRLLALTNLNQGIDQLSGLEHRQVPALLKGQRDQRLQVVSDSIDEDKRLLLKQRQRAPGRR